MNKTDIKDIFNGRRAGLYFKKYLMDNKSSILLSGTFMALLMLVIALMNGYLYYAGGDGVETELGFFTSAVFLGGMLTASIVYKDMWTKDSALANLMCPASQFEKFLVRWFIAVPCYVIFVTVCAVAVDFIRYLIVNFIFDGSVHMADWGGIFSCSSAEYGNTFYYLILALLFIQSFYLLGSIVWRKHCFIKTTMVIGLIWTIYMSVAANIFLTVAHNHELVGGENDMFKYGLTVWCVIFVILFNYTLTYMRYREADIIHKW